MPQPAALRFLLPLLLAVTACSGGSGGEAPAALDPARVSAVTVGRSTRADVFKALGQPKQTERSASGEAWVYEAREPKQNLNRLAGGAAAGSAIAGAFIPYVGLLGSGLGLANAAAGPGAPPASTTLTVAFGETGLVRDCIVATTAPPTPQAAGQPPLDCTRPVTR